jgi:5-(carboxyamino)imidazole ribonucleotide synthase
MTVGIVGGGQLGRMLAMAGFPLGLKFVLFDPSADAPAGAVAPLTRGEFDDRQLLLKTFETSDVVTYEFENVPVDSARELAGRTKVFPPPVALEISQDRLEEKRFFRKLGIGTADFRPVDSIESLKSALEELGLPAVLKTRRLGYDGKGQAVITSMTSASQAWDAVGKAPSILEQWILFDRELSVISVRGRNGELKFYPLVENHHRDGILRVSRAPAPDLTSDLQILGETIAATLMDALGYVGVIAIELFEWKGKLIANEFAPRVHNSGHWTIEGAVTSQFENHLRAICGMPLGDTKAIGSSAMINIIGELPDMSMLMSMPDVHPHLYGKESRPKRKIGHVTVCGDGGEEFRKRVAAVREIVEPARRS